MTRGMGNVVVTRLPPASARVGGDKEDIEKEQAPAPAPVPVGNLPPLGPLLFRDLGAGVLGTPLNIQFWARAVGPEVGGGRRRKHWELRQMRLMEDDEWRAPNGRDDEGAKETRTWKELLAFEPQDSTDGAPHPPLWEA